MALPPGMMDMTPLLESIATEVARRYLKVIRERRGSLDALNETELEEMLVKAYSMGFAGAAKAAEQVGPIRIQMLDKRGNKL